MPGIKDLAPARLSVAIASQTDIRNSSHRHLASIRQARERFSVSKLMPESLHNIEVYDKQIHMQKVACGFASAMLFRNYSLARIRSLSVLTLDKSIELAQQFHS